MRSLLTRLHEDEQGLEALQVVMIVAIAALILGLVKWWYPQIKSFLETQIKNILGW
jgi:hypothetical protein